MRGAHQQVLTASEKAEIEAENFYLELKRRKRKEKEAERAAMVQEAKEERERRRQADQEAKKPILKSFVTNEFQEINKLLSEHSKSIVNKGGRQKQPDPVILAQEIQFLDKRFNEALVSYNQYMAMADDNDGIKKFRDFKVLI